MAAAVPRDISTDAHGHWYIRGRDGALHAYGANGFPAPIATKGKPGGSGTGTIANAVWSKGGAVETATGRLYFSMAGGDWVCSGTTVTNLNPNPAVSLILTAAHCVYDDANKAFATNVMFIPDLAASGTATSGTCLGDYVFGCWKPSYGVVSGDWTRATWPSNIPYDYGIYVVSNTGAHAGGGAFTGALDALGALPITWDTDTVTGGMLTDAIGYTYKYDPQLMYCEQGLQAVSGVYGGEPYVNRWLSACRLGGGSSGGPWMAAMPAGAGPVISLNSWGYQGRPGMAGPNLQLAEPRCVYDKASTAPAPSEPDGYVATCP